MERRETNWAGNVAFRARRVHRPSSVEQVQEIVAHSPRVRALGSGHSFSEVADTDGDLVVLDGLPQTVEVAADRSTVTVAADLRYAELCRRLHERGLALHNLASLPHISVAGSCATATHGSGDGNGNLATAVAAVELVTGDGELTTVRRNDRRFDGVVVGLGALGVVVRLTLEVMPAFDMRQYVWEGMALGRLDDHLEEVFSAGYSVSLFTDWREPVCTQVWVKRRADDDRPANPTWLGAWLADGPRHPIPGMPQENCTEQLGVPGPWYERLPHFRSEFTPSAGEELQSEYLVPRDRALDALRAVDGIREQVAPVLQVSEVRTVAADELWLSPSYRRDTAGIHFTWVNDAHAVAPVMGMVEQRLEPFRARPHWGKLFTTPPEVLHSEYERMADFAELAEELDPAAKFRNDFVDRHVPR